eukprot:CAMPEP_0172554734 /NCGR_PEP_ID=MMETSP1067-20121228/56226_1 /TAXON_ID=265564 ORGANISM="Thalassiosira punctigera, Strain Tpunct2005C2" /NCGR_SAMPLE_ID=MMETSP1067 /ASSEMBLY_ACC=CAM_ASM_000444 /LENGTH=148 /DNA_ID=CAMNT_0013343161 /DNA_START=21 /DNA_END=467 /DNA_ORIENTATION=-
MVDAISPRYSLQSSARRSLGVSDGEAAPLLAEDMEATSDDSIYKYWIFLFLAIVFEVAGTTAMKLSDGLTKLIPSIAIYVFYGLSFAIFPLALKRIDLSTAYAIWSGLGTTLTCAVGFIYFDDSINRTKTFAVAAIIGGCIMLKSSEN